MSSNAIGGQVLGPVVQAGAVHGDVHVALPGPAPMPKPAQLPPAGVLVNRAAELADLRRRESAAEPGRPAVVVISGPGGIGKTTLALAWLHPAAATAGADGCLYAHLGGACDQGPVNPAEPLGAWLRALGIAPHTVPIGVEERAALFRSLTAERRLVLLLDDAASAAQVRPLLPAGPALVVVTARRPLIDLVTVGASFHELDVLEEEAAVTLLARLAGWRRVNAQPHAARALARLCGGLPLALSACGARLAMRNQSMDRLAAELSDEQRALTVLDRQGDLSVNAALNTSYRALSTEQARAYRLLSLHPGPHVDTDSAAALLGVSPQDADRLLEELAATRLVTPGNDDRYTFHDLVLLHARQKSHDHDEEAVRRAALARLADWYLRTAAAADLHILPGRLRLGDYYTDRDRLDLLNVNRFADRAEALAWLERERAPLVATAAAVRAQGMHELVWQLAEAMWPLFVLRRYYQDWIRLGEMAVASAQACAGPRVQARMLEYLGAGHLGMAQWGPAEDLYRRALELERADGHRGGEGTALEGLGNIALATGDPDTAATRFAAAQDIYIECGHPRGAALMQRHLGEALIAAGDYPAAIRELTGALRYFAQPDVDEPYLHARTLTALGRAQRADGRHSDAHQSLRDALHWAHQAGAPAEQANVHRELATLAPDADTAREHLQTAVELYRATGDVRQARLTEDALDALTDQASGGDPQARPRP